MHHRLKPAKLSKMPLSLCYIKAVHHWLFTHLHRGINLQQCQQQRCLLTHPDSLIIKPSSTLCHCHRSVETHDNKGRPGSVFRLVFRKVPSFPLKNHVGKDISLLKYVKMFNDPSPPGKVCHLITAASAQWPSAFPLCHSTFQEH